MKQSDLQGTIRHMAARVDAFHMAGDDSQGPAGLISEVEAYMAVDSTLASLYKHYIDARAHRLRALKQSGEGSAMTEIARDMEDSAQSAIETRMIELKSHAMKRMNAERLMAQGRLREMDDCRAQAEKDYARRQVEDFAAGRQAALRQSQVQKQGSDSYFALLLMWWLMRQMAARTQLRLSLAGSFTVASDYDVRHAVRA